MKSGRGTARRRHDGRTRFWLCWSTIFLEGFDLVALGAILPLLINGTTWRLSIPQATVVATVGVLGVLIGAASFGRLADIRSPESCLTACLLVFSVGCLLAATAMNPVTFTVSRFCAGLGLGGCLPVSLTIVSREIDAPTSAGAMTRLMTAYHCGALASAGVIMTLAEHGGWRVVYIIGGSAAVPLALMVARLPRGPRRLPVAGDAVQVTEGRNRRVIVTAGVVSVLGLLNVYGLNTWLPQTMRAYGFDVGGAVALLGLLNLGAVCGLLVAGRLATRFGSASTCIAWFAGAAAMLCVLAVPTAVPLTRAAAFSAGFFTMSAQVLVFAWTADLVPQRMRAGVLGLVSAVGRIGALSGPLVGGAIVASGHASPWGPVVFGLAAAGAAVAMTVGGRVAGSGDTGEAVTVLRTSCDLHGSGRPPRCSNRCPSTRRTSTQPVHPDADVAEVTALAEVLRARIRTATGLIASVGAGSNKLVAKIGPELAKPDGLTVVAPGEEASTLAPLPIGASSDDHLRAVVRDHPHDQSHVRTRT
jgi:AAHS family benzoate transporter-like MFS transporter